MPDALFTERFSVQHDNFETAGEASSRIKRALSKLGVPSAVIRDVAIAAYEAELNLVIHSLGGEILMELTQDKLTLTISDVGPGIADLSLAMKEGYSTAPENVRMMGFGAGMGLPNIKRHSHSFEIQSTVGIGTRITASYRF